jgi:hypothetical protein
MSAGSGRFLGFDASCIAASRLGTGLIHLPAGFQGLDLLPLSDRTGNGRYERSFLLDQVEMGRSSLFAAILPVRAAAFLHNNSHHVRMASCEADQESKPGWKRGCKPALLVLALAFIAPSTLLRSQDLEGLTLEAMPVDIQFSDAVPSDRPSSEIQPAEIRLSGHEMAEGQAVEGVVEAFEPGALKPHDFNTDIYYRNKLEFSLESGVLWINIPFVFDVFVGGDYSQKPLHYTLVPVFPSVRWHMGNVNGPGVLRGNTDLTGTISFTGIVRGPETRYEAFDLGVRRNFVYRNWRAAPYFEFRTGVGFINAQEPHGVTYAQGQDLTFTLMLGDGIRYNFNPKYSVALGGTYMHVSNLYLSEPKYLDNGINVVGLMAGFNMRIGKPKGASRQ